MENKQVEEKKKQLLESLTPIQRKYLDAIDWLLHGGRGAGRTHLLCVVALIHVLNGQPAFVLEHSPFNESSRSYTKNVLLSIANKIDLQIKISDVRNGFMVSLDAYRQFKDEKRLF